jgi:hypothetical protein
MELPSANQLKRALVLKEKIDELNLELSKILGTAQGTNGHSTGRGGARISAAGRERIAQAQRERWARIKGLSKPAAVSRRKMSPAARARISAAAKKRWQAAKAAGRSRL